MKAKYWIVAVGISFLAVSFCTEMAGERLQDEDQEKKQEMSQEKSEIKSLIRKDLLLRERKKLVPPKRNIFSPGTMPIEGTGVEARDQRERLPGLTAEPEAKTEREMAISSFDLKYIGYVTSDQKIVGLIIFRGEPLAVEQGDLIAEGVEVGKITTAEIEIVGPDSKQRKYSLEEEKP